MSYWVVFTKKFRCTFNLGKKVRTNFTEIKWTLKISRIRICYTSPHFNPFASDHICTEHYSRPSIGCNNFIFHFYDVDSEDTGMMTNKTKKLQNKATNTTERSDDGQHHGHGKTTAKKDGEKNGEMPKTTIPGQGATLGANC